MKIVLACDGSEYSKEAIKLASSMPFEACEFTLLNVVPLIEIDERFVSESNIEAIEEFNSSLRKETDKLLKEAKAILSKTGHDCKTEVLVGSPAEKIAEYAQQNQTDLVVMGSRGLNPLKSFFLGSVSDGLLRHAPCSVLLHRSADPKMTPKNLESLVLGFDDTESSRHASTFIKSWDLAKVKEIDIISVMQMSFYYGMNYSLTVLDTWPKHKETIEEALQSVERDLKTKSSEPKIKTEILSDAYDVANELNRYAQENKRDLIVVGSKGKNLMDRMFLGSVSNKLAHSGELPILVVR